MRMTARYQLSSVRRSLNLLFSDWANRGLNLWTIEQATSVLADGTTTVTPGTDTVNVLSAVVRDTINGEQQDISIDRIGRSDIWTYPISSPKLDLLSFMLREAIHRRYTYIPQQISIPVYYRVDEYRMLEIIPIQVT